MAAAAAKYSADDVEASQPMKVCAEAGRKCVRNIHQHPILSADWLALIDSLKQLTRLVQLEGRMPANTKVSEVHGRNIDSEGTLWDQETHENAIRILVEEAKVNLCLRMMHDYKRWQYNPSEKQKSLQQATQALGHNEAQLEQKCKQFEESLGVLLWRSFTHVETLQLMDMPLLIEHVSYVFEVSEMASAEALADRKMQETMNLFYFSCMMKHAERLNNSEILAKMRETQLVHLAVQHVLSQAAGYTVDILHIIAEGFAALADNEDFRTDWETFFHGDDVTKVNFLALESKVVEPVLMQNIELKRELRPLLDFFRTLNRSMK